MTALLQDHHGRDPHRVALRNNNSAVAELLGGAMKRLSDCRVAAGDMVRVQCYYYFNFDIVTLTGGFIKCCN